MNRYNPEGKDIRFIDSHYNDLFRIPDGGHIQIDYGNETVVKPCTFIDEYHTQVGNNVFHICQFAEVMERNGNHYQAEPPIMGDEAAWQVGKDNYLAIQTCDDGYDYALFDKNFKEIDGGQVDNPDMTMIEVRQDILESFGLAHRDLRAAVYEEVMEMSESVALPNPLLVMAGQLDSFAQDYDPYDYRDQVDNGMDVVESIRKDLAAGNTAPYREFLDSVIAESGDEVSVTAAKALRDQLDKFDTPKRASVMELLAQTAEKVAPAKPHKHKEPER